jgi:hypothetical protein
MFYVSHGDHWHFKQDVQPGMAYDLRFRALSRPFRFADGKEGQWTKSSRISGFEAWATIEGTLTWEGTQLSVKGLGVVERAKLSAMIWREVKWYDWIWVISDQLHLLHFHVNNGDYVDGKLFLTQSRDYLDITQATIEYPEVSYVPPINHFVSSKIRFTAATKKGTLFLNGNLLRMSKTAPYQDLEFEWQGYFSFLNGKRILLTHVRGADQQCCYYSIF